MIPGGWSAAYNSAVHRGQCKDNRGVWLSTIEWLEMDGVTPRDVPR